MYRTPPIWFFILPPDTFLFGTSSTVNFTVELSGVLSVVIVLVFSYEYFFNLHILGIHPLYYWLETSSTVFFLFCLLERFLYSVHEYSDNIYSLKKTHLHPGQCVLLFHE